MFNIIKNSEVELKDSKVISTLYVEHLHKDVCEKEDEADDDLLGNQQEELHQMKKDVIENANKEKEKILVEAMKRSEEIEKEAYEKGYNQGLENGHEDDYKEAYEKNIQKAEEEISHMKSQAQKFILSAQNEYDRYINENRENIMSLVLKISEQLTRAKLTEDDGLNNLIDEALEHAKDCKNIIIKCNENQKGSIEEQIELWKNKYSLKDKLFLLVDSSVTEGNVVIEKENGKSKVGIDAGFEKLRESLMQ